MKSVYKSRRLSHNASQQLGQLVRIAEHSSSSTDIRKDVDDSAISSIQASELTKINAPTKSRSRRKMDKSLIIKADTFVNEQPNISEQFYHDKTMHPKV